MQQDLLKEHEETEDDFVPLAAGLDYEKEIESDIEKEVEAVEPKQPEKKKREISGALKKKCIIAAASILGALILIYFGGVAYYNSHFFAGTLINGFKCSGMTVENARDSLINDIENYKFFLKERNNVYEEIAGKDIGLNLETIGSLEEVKANQNPWRWPFPGKEKYQRVNIIVTMDEAALDSKVEELNCVAEVRDKMKGANRLVTYNEESRLFEIPSKNEQMANEGSLFYKEVGNGYMDIERPRDKTDKDKNIVSVSKLKECVKNGIYGLYPDMDLDVEQCYVTMAEETNMKEALDKINKYVSAKVSYKKGDDIIPLDGGSIHFWVSMDENYNVYLNEDEVAQFVSDLSMKYNTIGMARPFVTSTGADITIADGDYGWRVDKREETAALCEIIKNGETTEREPIFAQKAYHLGSTDIGNSYVEISIKNQHLWMYKNGEVIVSTDIVTGNPYAGNATPTGVYRLKSRERDSILVGEDYRTPVSYWMPFNGGVGMHDANWRGSFGGSIYLGGGSHGCINLPPSIASKIFENISVGYPIIVY